MWDNFFAISTSSLNKSSFSANNSIQSLNAKGSVIILLSEFSIMVSILNIILFRQYLMTRLSNEDSMLELCRKRSIFCSHGPIIFIELRRISSEINHRLDSEDHPWLHLWSTVFLCLVINVRFFMKLYADTVPCIFTDN